MSRRAAWVTVGLLLSVGCASTEPSYRSLHYVDDELVHSKPPHARSYEAYLRARLAIEADPQRLDEAREYIAIAIRYDPREPHLWTTRAEIEAAAGDLDAAMASLDKALALRPNYAPAMKLMADLDGRTGAASAKVETSESPR